MIGSFKIEVMDNLEDCNRGDFILNSKKPPGELLLKYHITTEGNTSNLHRDGLLLIQKRLFQGEELFFIHPYSDEERKAFPTFGEAVGVLINEIIGEINV
ncbi:hypothetical protein LCGC14_1962850 [marine sediment metagenome]|uniref:Uncharacterized protein n=1 Tax=marine sediment metagenome TaxID=412755 RepID=A0A0F9FED3_9ZZZZ